MSETANMKIEAILTHTHSLKVIRKPEGDEVAKKPVRLGSGLIRKRRQANEFEDWIVPDQPTGYIKARKNEIL